MKHGPQLVAVASLAVAVWALLSASLTNNLRMVAVKAKTDAYYKGYEAGGRFVVRCYVRSNVYLAPLVVSNSVTISHCLFLRYDTWTALGVDNVPTNSNVYINVNTISVDNSKAIIE